METDLFKPLPKLDEADLDGNFKILRDLNENEPTRLMINKVFEYFKDIDGNFIEQFQTTGFDARLFELYIFAYLMEAGYKVHRDYDRPDFIIERDGIKVALEVTTVNPTRGATVSNRHNDLSKDELIEKLRNELPIKFGSPLYSKLKMEGKKKNGKIQKIKKKYWELEQCKNMPIVFVIEAFHEQDSLHYSSNALIQYLYGLRHELKGNNEGDIVEKMKILEHQFGNKIIPSGFFKLPEAENISAVIFSNSGTTAKFKRLGYYCGCVSSFMKLNRIGVCYDHNPSALAPKQFAYDLDEKIDEGWGEGLEVFHNPHAKFPLPKDFFDEAAYHYIENSELISFLPEFFPYYSKTFTVIIDTNEENVPKGINVVPQLVINNLIPNRAYHLLEKGWFIDDEDNKIGIILIDHSGWFQFLLYELIDGSFELVFVSPGTPDYAEVKHELFLIMLA